MKVRVSLFIFQKAYFKRTRIAMTPTNKYSLKKIKSFFLLLIINSRTCSNFKASLWPLYCSWLPKFITLGNPDLGTFTFETTTRCVLKIVHKKLNNMHLIWFSVIKNEVNVFIFSNFFLQTKFRSKTSNSWEISICFLKTKRYNVVNVFVVFYIRADKQ